MHFASVITLLAGVAYAGYGSYPVPPPKYPLTRPKPYLDPKTTVAVPTTSSATRPPPITGGKPPVLGPVETEQCMAREPSHFCGEDPVATECAATPCPTPTTASCEVNALRLEKSDLAYIRLREEPKCCCAQKCMDDVECDGVEFDNEKCWLLSGRNKPSWVWNVTQPKTVSSIYVKTYTCNDVPPTKADLSLAPLQGRSIPLVHTVGTTAGTGGQIDNGFFVCYAKSDVALCDLLPFGTDKNSVLLVKVGSEEYSFNRQQDIGQYPHYQDVHVLLGIDRELVVGGDIEKPLGYCARSRGNCGATEAMKEWSHISRYDKVYRVPGIDENTVTILSFKESGLLPCYFWPNRYNYNC